MDIESICQECGKDNVVWSAPHDIWNELYPNEGIVCPSCFDKKAQEKGYKIIFRAEIVK